MNTTLEIALPSLLLPSLIYYIVVKSLTAVQVVRQSEHMGDEKIKCGAIFAYALCCSVMPILIHFIGELRLGLSGLADAAWVLLITNISFSLALTILRADFLSNHRTMRFLPFSSSFTLFLAFFIVLIICWTVHEFYYYSIMYALLKLVVLYLICGYLIVQSRKLILHGALVAVSKKE